MTLFDALPLLCHMPVAYIPSDEMQAAGLGGSLARTIFLGATLLLAFGFYTFIRSQTRLPEGWCTAVAIVAFFVFAWGISRIFNFEKADRPWWIHQKLSQSAFEGHPLNVNTATREQLEQVPGIGRTTATRIPNAHGPRTGLLDVQRGVVGRAPPPPRS